MFSITRFILQEGFSIKEKGINVLNPPHFFLNIDRKA